MNIFKLITYVIFILLFWSCKPTTFPIGQKNETFNSYDENWKFFELDEPIKARVLIHLPSTGLCGNIAFASVSIVQTKDEQTFRILDLCNNSNISENEIVKIIPAKKPEFSVLLPSRTFINPQTEKAEQYDWDKETLKTTYGHIENK
jgi:hypothetical protein